MLHLRKEFVIDTTGSMGESSKQVELESKVSEGVHNGIRFELVDVAQDSTLNDDILHCNSISLPPEERERNI